MLPFDLSFFSALTYLLYPAAAMEDISALGEASAPGDDLSSEGTLVGDSSTKEQSSYAVI